MNKNIVIGVVLVLVLVGGVYYFSSEKNEESMMQNESAELVEENTGEVMEEKEAVMQEENVTEGSEDESVSSEVVEVMKKAGSYELYSAEKIALASDNNVVLFFRASWCPTCKAVDKDIRANLDEIPSDLVLLDVDYDKSSELKKKYGVTYQHTFVQVDKEGNMLKKWSGSSTLASILKEIK
ncbi:MAG: thioredoxin family protein [Candidatus Pacebacteria bacterium]|nr:thioredoxin family protein [Candidatus Paceibacterota bacterium]MCF7862727.1 thioredoxin family protein [Candidatus Paceibacterota bacterium]